jgi:putative NADH-flavin reductase
MRRLLLCSGVYGKKNSMDRLRRLAAERRPGSADPSRAAAPGTIDALEQLRRESELDWSLLAPSAQLQPGQRTGKFRMGGDQLLVDAHGDSRTSLQDYAVAMLDELEHSAHVRQRITVGSLSAWGVRAHR